MLDPSCIYTVQQRVARCLAYPHSEAPMDSSITTNPPSAAYQDKSDGPTSSHLEHHQLYESDAVIEDNLRSTRLGRYGNFVQPYVAEFSGTMLLPQKAVIPRSDLVSPLALVSVCGSVQAGRGVILIQRSPSPLPHFANFLGEWYQLLGGFIGAALIYANYYHAINIFEGGSGVRTLLTAGNFGTYPLDYMTNASAFFSEFLGTALLVFIVFAATDPRNAIPSAAIPFILFTVLLGIALCLGMETGFAVNPARDLGPRLLTSIVGYGGAVYSFRHQYWLWGGILAPILGGVTGACFYDILFIDSGRFRNVLDRKEAAVRSGNGKSAV
ncbi:aquaporin 4 [Lentinula edodes]|uniref:Aquaporin 4 n=1 Tax=Lentinula edodes TaxID=5353 RepID=A0A1Q3E808_LENED|nr:aquaporin 4 [Lentinula edodes]